MDFLTGLAKAEVSKPNSDQPENSSPDLLSSAKLVAEGAQAEFNHQPDKVDNAKVAGAAADLIDAATKYGKLDESQGIGKYLGETEGYLRNFSISEKESSPVSKTENANDKISPAAAAAAAPESEKPAPIKNTDTDINAEKPPTATETEKPQAQIGGGEGDYLNLAEGLLNKATEGTGAADYVKIAEGLLSKTSESEGGGGYGALANLAGDFLKK